MKYLYLVYRGDIRFTQLTVKTPNHVEWFEHIGLPNSGAEYDNIQRGNISIKGKYIYFTDYIKSYTPNYIVDAFFAKYPKYTNLEVANPAISASQYGMAQAVLSGLSKSMPVRVARELVDKTPKKLREKFAKELAKRRKIRGNPTVDIEAIRHKLVHAVTEYDRKQSTKPGYNMYALPQYLRSIQENVIPALISGKSIRQAILSGFNGRLATAALKSVGEPAITKEEARWNPGDIEEGLEGLEDTPENAEELSQLFHGRPSTEIIELDEIETYENNLAQLGVLVELEILVGDDKDEVVPINWNYNNPKERVLLCSTPDGKNILFIGGDQELDLEALAEQGAEIDWAIDTSKRYIEIGPVHTISYFADKHHLEGGEDQKKGSEYIHEFGEEDGVRPDLVYDTKDKRMMLTGGSYLVEEEGIKN